MGTSYNSSVVQDGLIFNLDAANPKSYPGTPTVEVLIVGGGGGGGMDMGGGGGGGGVIQSTDVPITLGVGMTVTVGLGGWGAPAGGGGMRGDGAGPQPANHAFTIGATDGGSSSFGGLTAIGGGHGASSYIDYTPDLVSSLKTAGSGGSGGGMSGYCYKTMGGGSGTLGQGYPGGIGGPAWWGGGGGGAGGPGIGNTATPHGGPGVLSAINGTSLYWGGGGGGAAYSLSPGGNGGIGGGGGGAVGATTGGAGLNAGAAGGGGAAGAQCNTPGGNGGANTGGGGGGGSHYNLTNQGGNGGSGIVIIRYRGVQNATGGTITTSGDYTVHTFLSSGTFTPDATWKRCYDLSTTGNVAKMINGVGVSSGSFTFNGSSHYILSGLSGPSTTSLSVSTLFKVTGYPASYTQVVGDVGGASFGMYLGTSGVFGQIYVAGAYYTNTSYTLPTGTWCHATFTWTSGGTVKLYINGVYQSQTAVATGAISYTGNIQLGYYTGVLYLNGNVSHAQIYKRQLTDSEVLQNFNALRGRYGL